MSELTSKRKALIKESWGPLKHDHASLGVEYLVRLFTEYPQYLSFFDSSKRKEPDVVRALPKARLHGPVLMKTLDKVVNNLDDLDFVVVRLRGLVSSHYPRGVTPLHFKNALECFVQFLPEKLKFEFSVEMREAWEAFVCVLVSIIEEEYKRVQKG